jgi:LysM repeat protein
MKTIGIKLADGSFYPILEEGTAKTYQLDLTTVKDGQTKVQIDLYRSASGTMEDAEYVDTLEVTNLVPHPNGEAELHLSVGLNENNELDAKVVDEETGKQSETNVTLVSRTLAERSEPTNFELSDSAPEDASLPSEESSAEENSDNSGAVAAAALGGAALGAAAAYAVTKDGEDNETNADSPVTETVDEVPFSFDSEISEEQKDDGSNSDSLFGENAIVEDLNTDTSASETAESTEGSDSSFDFDDLASEDVSDDFNEPTDAVADGSVDETFSFDNEETSGITAESIPEMNEDMFDNDSFSSEITDSQKEDFTEESVTAEAPAEESISDTSALLADLPDETAADTDTEISETDFSADIPETTEPDDFALPDFDAPAVTDIDSTETVSDTEASGLSGYFNDPDLNDDPVFNETNLDTSDSEINFDTSDLDSSSPVSESNGVSSAPAMDFSDLYDKETLNGESSSYDEDDEEENKTRVPMIICIICAIICVIATVLVLFIVPSKYNLIKKSNSKETVVEQTIEAPVHEESPVEIEVTPAPAAEEDKVVVAPESEKVVPVPPPAPKEKKTKEVKYRIRWGDTLWDIADAYYKNPWRYPKIAKYNKIKNPDLIISGTDILIPVE